MRPFGVRIIKILSCAILLTYAALSGASASASQDVNDPGAFLTLADMDVAIYR